MREVIKTLEGRLDAAEAHVAELTKKVDNVFKLLVERFAVVDTQQTMINARANERTPVAKGGGAPVQFGSATPYDAQVGRIDARRRELLGKK